MITFQNIKFEILQEYYYDEGRNYKIKEVIQNLFYERLKNKNNHIQVVYKLIMNSGYGKNLLKPTETTT